MIRIAGRCRVMAQPRAGKFPHKWVILRLIHKLKPIGELGFFAAGVTEDQVVEFLICVRITNERGKGRNPRARGHHPEPLGRQKRIIDQCASGLFAH